MKPNLVLGVVAALSMSQALAAAPVMEAQCSREIRSAVSILEGSYSRDDEETLTVTEQDTASIKISNVRILASSCIGPADCDARHPDAFTYAADIGKSGEGLSGKVVVKYHRGNCLVKKITLKQ